MLPEKRDITDAKEAKLGVKSSRNQVKICIEQDHLGTGVPAAAVQREWCLVDR